MNIFAFAYNSPQNHVDSDGKFPIWIPAGVGFGAGLIGGLNSGESFEDIREDKELMKQFWEDDIKEGKCTVVIFFGHYKATSGYDVPTAIKRLNRKGGSACRYAAGFGCSGKNDGINDELSSSGLMGEDGYNLIPDLPGLPSTMDGSASFPPKGRGGLVEDLDDKLVNGDSSARGLNPHMPSWVNEEHWKTMHGWQKQRIILEDFVKKAKSAADKLCEDKVHCCCKSVGIHLIFLKQSAISRSGFTKSMADRRGNWVNLHFSKLSGDHLIWNVPCK